MNNPRPITALTGPAGSGKDTVADYLVARYGYTKIAFADAVRAEICAAFGVPLDTLLDRETKELPIKALSLSRCNDHRFAAVCLNIDLVMDIADSEAVEACTRQPRSPRRIMQLWGTEYRRKLCCNDYWIVEISQRLEAIAGPVVITDCRFEDEAEYLSELGAEIWQLHRPGTAPVAEHRSETPLPRYLIDRDLDNTGDINLLHLQADHALTMMDLARVGAA